MLRVLRARFPEMLRVLRARFPEMLRVRVPAFLDPAFAFHVSVFLLIHFFSPGKRAHLWLFVKFFRNILEERSALRYKTVKSDIKNFCMDQESYAINQELF